MLFIWGRKAVTRRLGYVADYCPICKAQRAFKVQRVGSAGHIYYISFGEGELVGFQRVCPTCLAALPCQPTSYATLSKTALPLDELKAATFPNLDEALRETLQLEARIRSAPHSFSKEERHVLIRDAFMMLSPKVEKRFASMHIDLGVGLSMLGAIALLFLGPVVMRVLDTDNVITAFLILFGAGLALIASQIMLSGRRYMQREIIPLLAKNLVPLQPAEAELKQVVSELKRLRHKIGAKTNIATLMAAMNSAPRSERLEPSF